LSQITLKITESVLTDAFTKLTGNDTEIGGNLATVAGSYAAGSTNTPLTMAFTVANVVAVYLISDKGCTIKTNGTGTSEVQTLTITGTPTGGTFALGFGGQVTAPINYNATATDVQTALRALSSIGSTGVTCTGGPLPGSAVTITFAGTLANTNVTTIATNGAGSLTGGTTPTSAVAVTTAGKPSDVVVLKAGLAYVWKKSANYNPLLFTTDVTSAYVDSTLASQLQGFVLTI
jgi:hypothetical protein